MGLLMRFVIACLVCVALHGAEPPHLFDGTNYLPARVSFTNRVVTFTNSSGRLFENVRLESVGLDGLKWSAEAGVGGGRVPLADLTPGTRETLGIPAAYAAVAEREEKARTAAKVNAIFEKMDREQAARAAAHKKDVLEKFDKAVGEYQKHGVFGTLVWSRGVVKVDVGPPFFLLDHGDKKLAVLAVIARAALEDPSVKAAKLLDRYSGQEIGRLDSAGFFLK